MNKKEMEELLKTNAVDVPTVTKIRFVIPETFAKTTLELINDNANNSIAYPVEILNEMFGFNESKNKAPLLKKALNVQHPVEGKVWMVGTRGKGKYYYFELVSE